MRRKTKYHNIIQYLFVFSLITTSGAGVIGTIYFLVFTTVLGMLLHKKIYSKAIFSATFISIYLFINSAILSEQKLSVDLFVVHIIRIFCVAIIISYIDSENWKEKYINIIYALAVNSLIWWVILFLFSGIRLPFTFNEIGTFYHCYTLGTKRNSGIFWEPGVYQIYLNLAFIFLLFGKELNMNEKKRRKRIIVIAATIFSTFSTMGYICFFIVLTVSLLSKTERIKGPLKIGIIFILLALAIIEMSMGVIESKISNVHTSSSLGSRLDDFIIGINILKDNWITGIGVATITRDIYLKYAVAFKMYYGGRASDLAHSNGLINMLVTSGVPFGIYYLISLWKWLCNNIQRSALSDVVLYSVMMLFFINEPVLWTPFWLLCFFFQGKEISNRTPK